MGVTYNPLTLNCDSAAWQLWHTSGLNTVRLTSGKQYNTDSRAKACRKSTRLAVLTSSGNVTQKWYQNDGHVMMKSSSTTVNQIKAQTGKKLNNQPNKQKQQSSKTVFPHKARPTIHRLKGESCSPCHTLPCHDLARCEFCLFYTLKICLVLKER